MRCKAKVDFRKLGKFDTVSLVDMMAEAGKKSLKLQSVSSNSSIHAKEMSKSSGLPGQEFQRSLFCCLCTFSWLHFKSLLFGKYMTLYLFFLGTILHLLNKLTDPFPLLLFTYNSNCTMYTFEIRSNCLNLLSKRFMKGILPPFENKNFYGKIQKI